MNETNGDSLALDIEESSLLYARLKRDEDRLSPGERELLRKSEAFLYAFLSIEELEDLVRGEGGLHR